MADVKVGMRLRSIYASANLGGDITVTEITKRGFKYSYDAPISVHPRLGIVLAKDDHEHFGSGGDALYEPIE